MPNPLQGEPGALHVQVVVLHQQHPHPGQVDALLLLRLPGRGLIALVHVKAQVYLHPGAHVPLALDADIAAHLLHQLLGDGQAQAGAGVAGPGAILLLGDGLEGVLLKLPDIRIEPDRLRQIPGITDFIERTEDLVRSGILIVDADGKILKNMIVFH